MAMQPSVGKAVSAGAAALGAFFGLWAASPALASEPANEVIISDGLLFPESLTSTPDGALLFGSTTTSTILRAEPGAKEASPWFDGKEAALGRVLGVLADGQRDMLWVCSSAQDTAKPEESLTGLAAFRLSDQSLIGTFPFPDGKGLCNDIAVDEKGTVYATDTREARVLRLADPAGPMEVWSADPLLEGVDGVAIASDGSIYVNSIVSGELLRLDPAEDGKSADPVRLTLSRELGKPDGMRTAPDGSLIVAEQAGRVSRIEIAGDEARITTIAEGFTQPPAVTIVGDRAYVLQSNLFFNRDPERKGTDPGPARAIAVPLKAS